jgi:uncharacterized protein with ParB-like and HNH nuclease domain
MRSIKIDKTVSDFREYKLDGKLVLQPEYQRNFVWSNKQKVYLIDSILNEYPLPKIYIKGYEKNGKKHIEVIDGQQRLTSILDFIDGKFCLSKKEHPDPINFDMQYEGMKYSDLSDSDQSKIKSLLLTCEEIDGTEEEVRNLFYRLNSQIKMLTTQEIKSARYTGDFQDLVKKLNNDPLIKDKFSEYKVISKLADNRKSSEDIIASCLTFQLNGTLTDYKKVDQSYEIYKSLPEEEFIKQEKQFKWIFKFILEDLFEGKIAQSLFAQKNTYISFHEFFYDLKYIQCNTLNIESARKCMNELAYQKTEGTLLGVDWSSTLASKTNQLNHKRRRLEILESLFQGLFVKKDSKRAFSNEQRIIAWNKSDKICKICNSEITSFDDYDLDHILPHSLGGETTLENSQVTHISCNRSKKNNI